MNLQNPAIQTGNSENLCRDTCVFLYTCFEQYVENTVNQWWIFYITFYFNTLATANYAKWPFWFTARKTKGSATSRKAPLSCFTARNRRGFKSLYCYIPHFTPHRRFEFVQPGVMNDAPLTHNFATLYPTVTHTWHVPVPMGMGKVADSDVVAKYHL